MKLIPRAEQVSHIRAAATVQSDASGNGDDEVYKVPAGMEFEVRRIALTLTGNAPNDPNTGNVLLNVAGKFVAYTRSGTVIEYGQPQYGSAIQVPGIQTWGDQQGPFIRNGEVLGVVFRGLTASTMLSVYIEGLLKRPASGTDH